MSADADRSSYRYTKDVISGRYDEIFASYVDFTTITNVLDVGSNRGAFVNYLEHNHQGKFIEAIEPDTSVVKEYADRLNVNVQVCRFENAELPTNYFDFAYCAHTLEHASSARLMLHGIGKALKPGGKFFLAVPNLLFYEDVIEEIFIDPHVYHFSYSILKECVEQLGFVIEYAGSPQEHEIIFLLRKIGSTFEEKIFLPLNLNLANQNKDSISNYHLKILRNRESLKESVELLNQASLSNKIVIWGGGRIFDALVRFGHLDVSKVYMVVDKYLHRYVKELYGRPLMSPDTLADLDTRNILVYIASREYAVEIEEEARKLGVRNFISFGEIFS
ncbi:class I SAM-dependent methyltransferase [Polynucleobacter paneuropaeus]|nr:class I SAM-dependent methyltransferase [Polynucleobacter paneuropaeus]